MPRIYRNAVLLILAAAALAQPRFALRDGDRVVFYGDSITDQRLYTTFAETYVVTRFPKLDVSFVHSGWGGDRVSGGGGGPIDVRLWRDVLAYNPTVMTIMLGMNDGHYQPFNQQAFDDFTAGYKHIVDVAKKQLPGIRITAIQPSPYDDVTRPPLFEGGYNAVLLRFSDFLKQLATDQKLALADLNTPVVAMLTQAKELDAAGAAKILPDRVHPGAGGHLIMAEALLKAWNAPETVSAVEIDAARKEILRQVNARVTDLQFGRGVSWTEMDDALPMPFDTHDAGIALAVRASDFRDALDRQPLTVRGLAAGSYTLGIDGDSIGAFTAAQLAHGINLAELPTPMLRQAAAVHALTLQHAAMHQTRWRNVQVPLEKTDATHLPQALQALDALEADLIHAQRAAAQPKAHQFEITPE
ncbi:MAG TPA: SGNH/GDSL hydrolase family protein [Bryobacteraceae bacterium]|nr:SGNH/GDSL hydrolase family protein [Bryobacteraceae bacterium]